MSTEIDDDFVNVGVLHFADAHAAVETFRDQMRRCVREAIGGAGDGVWRIPTGGKIKSTRSVTYGLWCGAGGQLELLTGDPAPASLDVGIRWNWATLPAQPLLLCAVFGLDSPRWLIENPVVPPESGVELTWDGKYANYWIVPDRESPQLRNDLRRLLNGVRAVVAASVP